MPFEPKLEAIAVGTLPHTDVELACRLMIEGYPEMPAWPQLPRRRYLENMYVQYSEGLPGIRVDEPEKRTFFDVGERLEDELEPFYQAVIDEDLDRFRISADYAAGLDMFLGGLADDLSGKRYVKGQVTGPVSFGLTVTDQDGKASLYNETLEQVIVKGLSLKAAWQSRALAGAAPGAKVIMFFDEPYLHSVGSALLSVSREQVIGDITECLNNSGADITGVHCCGNTDWSLVFATGVDIVHFDAYEYLENFVAYRDEIANHLGRGGAIAWGVIPKDEGVFTESCSGLVEKLESAFDELVAAGIDRELLATKSIVSPSCGLGPSPIEAAEKGIALTTEVSQALRERYF